MKLDLTYEQQCTLVSIIDDWYLYWKNHMTDSGVQHSLGIAKEQLKKVICEGKKFKDSL